MDSTGVAFANELDLDSSMNVFLYRNYYNGGGVAVGDFDGDGLEDLYLTANRQSNRLYRNLGNFRFEDITVQAGVGGTAPWSTGVAMADVNADGLLDIYVCNSGDIDGSDKVNELFLNQGDGTFKEGAAAVGLDDAGFTTHASFFDYDHDGDLDCYILNNSFRPIATLGLRNLRTRRDTLGGDKLYRNDGGYFTDVSEEAGIFGSVIGFGLGVSVADVTGDGWEDIYVSNDFYERDYLYVNTQEGGFREELTSRMQTLSHFSMGADISDLNNDGRPEIFVTDMLPKDDARLKQTTKFADPNDYATRLERGFHHQAMRNTLQWNLGDGTFAEVGQLHGVAATDWSWGALLADFDNNGYRDIIVCNGAYKDVTNQDFINYMSSDEAVQAAKQGAEIDFQSYVDRIPSTPMPNAAFANLNGQTFADSSAAWGFSRPTHSNGAAYADLDLDGDLDLVVNNLNAPTQLLKNTTVERGGRPATSVKFRGDGGNPFAIGASARLYYDGAVLSYDHLPVKGFQSSMTYQPVLALPNDAVLDSAIFQDAYGRVIRLGSGELGPQVNIDFTQGDRVASSTTKYQTASLPWSFVTAEVLIEPILHTEDSYNEFDRDRLLYFSSALDGPAFAIGKELDATNSLMYFGGSASAPGRLLRWNSTLSAYESTIPRAFAADKGFEDVAAAFIDFDQDGDDDLIVGSAGSEFIGTRRAYRLRLYEQRKGRDGRGEFLPARRGTAPAFPRPVSAIEVADINDDGRLDFITAGRLHPDGYGLPSPIAVYLNTGGRFRLPPPSGTQRYGEGGLVSDLTMADVDGDGKKELVAVGEFMPVTIYFSTTLPFDSVATIPNTRGLYRSVTAVDLANTGQDQLVCGNVGQNTFLSGANAGPLHLYIGDVDGNGQIEHIYAFEKDGKQVPIALKHELEKPIPSIKKSFVKFADFADKTLKEVFSKSTLDSALHLEADRFESLVCSYSSEEGWKVKALPLAAQVSIVMSSCAEDVDGDGDLDVLLGGNLYGNQPRLGPLDASRGTLLLNENGTLTVGSASNSLGLYGQVRNLLPFTDPNGRRLVAVAKNQGQLTFARFNDAIE